MAEKEDAEKATHKNDEENLIVALRVRPISEDEIIQGATPIAYRVNKKMVVLMDPMDSPDDVLRVNRSREKQYVFDLALDGTLTQKEVYEKTCRFLIPSVINGFNATVFAYGATGTGKTYTMLGTDEDPGIMARALNDLFLDMDKTSEDMTYNVTMSYLEIYNEMIRDLLNPSSGVLDLREDGKGVQVAGLSEISASSTGDVMDILFLGNKRRTQEPTAANKTSSRSHAVLQVNVKQRNRVRNIRQEERIGRLFLIDLAGSERAANTLNRGKRMVEGAHINRSLLALGNCINALSDKNGQRYVNYRDSKLTRLLKDALSGNCKTVMIGHISPASIHFDESRNTLVYADRAKQIKTKVRKNAIDISYHVTQYANIIAELQEEIKRLRQKMRHQDHKSSINSIHSEVLGTTSKEGQDELTSVKEQLLRVFGDQMDYRKTLMELNNTAMEIGLEMRRNQRLLEKWEREANKQSLDGDDNRLKDGSSEIGVSNDPHEIKQAREELTLLVKEGIKTAKLKKRVTKELENAKEKTARIERILPKRIKNNEQQEIISLLCKVHELEIEKMHMQSSCMVREFQLSQRDESVTRYMQHRNLCDEIIQQQRALIDDHHITCPPELEDLYEAYKQEVGEMFIERDVVLPDIFSSTNKVTNPDVEDADTDNGMDKLSTVEEDASRLPKLFAPANGMTKAKLLKVSNNKLSNIEASEKLFSPSPRPRYMFGLNQKTDQSGLLSRYPHRLSPSQKANHQNERQKSIMTLSSNDTTPSQPDLGNSGEELGSISNNTRNIAALAAKRRSVIHHQTDETTPRNGSVISMEAKPTTSKHKLETQDSLLTQSRLEQHNRTVGSKNNTHAINNKKHDIKFGDQTDSYSSLRQLRKPVLAKNAGRKTRRSSPWDPNKIAVRHTQRTLSQSRDYYKQSTKPTPSHLTDGRVRPRIANAPTPFRTRISPATPHRDQSYDNMTVFTTDDTSPRHHRHSPTKTEITAGSKQTQDSTGSNVTSHTSKSSKKQAKKSKQIPPTISGYRKGDITVTGLGLNK